MKVWRGVGNEPMDAFKRAMVLQGQWHERMREYESSSGRRVFITSSALSGERAVGISRLDGEKEMQGWMLEHRSGFWKPRARGKGTNEARELLRDLQPPNVRAELNEMIQHTTFMYASTQGMVVAAAAFERVELDGIDMLWMHYGEGAPDDSPDWDGGEHFSVSATSSYYKAREQAAGKPADTGPVGTTRAW